MLPSGSRGTPDGENMQRQVGVNLPGGPVRQQSCCGGGRGPLRPGGCSLTERIGGSGGRRLGGVSDPAGGAAAGGGVPVVADVGQAGAARVTRAVAWRRKRRKGEKRRNILFKVKRKYADRFFLFSFSPVRLS